MTPKEKAEELISKMCINDFTDENINNSKQYALIAVDELINYSMPSSEFGGYIQSYTTEYWQEVKQEIEKL